MHHTTRHSIGARACLALCVIAIAQGCAGSDVPEEIPEAPVREGQDRPGDPTMQDDASLPYDEDLGGNGGDDVDAGGNGGDDDMGNGGDECADIVCAFGEARCSGEQIERCIEDALGCPIWGSPETCPGDEVCASDRCQVVNSCIDNDRDGYGPGCVNGPDCDDDEPLRNSGRVEVCDGLDNDCNNQVDDGIAGVGDVCTSGQGVCEAQGVTVCDASGQISCGAVAGTPSAETCDGLDNDCNGATDDGGVCGTPACAQDAQEPNDTLATGYLLAAETDALGLICQSDLDYYTLDVTPGVSHRVNVSFPHALSDQDLVLYEDGIEVQRAMSSSDHEQLEFTPRAGSVYTAQVLNVGGQDTFHRLVTTSSWACTSEDEFSPNQSVAQPALLLQSWLSPAHLCDGTEDWYLLGQVDAGDEVQIDAFFRAGLFDPGADLDMGLFANYDGDTTVERVAQGLDSFSDEQMTYTATGTTFLYVRVYAPFGGSNDYDIGWLLR